MFHCRQSATASSGFLAFGGIATFFSDHQTFFLGLLNIFLGRPNIFRLRLMSRLNWCGWRSIPKLNDFTTSVEALFWSPQVFCQIREKQHLWPFPMLFFHVSENTSISFHIFNTSPKNLSCDPKFALNIFSNCKTLCKFNWKGFQDKFANYSPRQGFCLQLKRSAKFSL